MSDLESRHNLPNDAVKVAHPHIQPQTGPGKGEFPAITLEGIARLAAFWNCSPKKAMLSLLEAGVWPLRFARNRGVYSAAEQAKLLSSAAAIVGCGGLGGHVATLLARLGVGTLSLCDYDVFDETNLNRQLLARESSLGCNKALVVADEVHVIASHVEVRAYPVFADPETLPDILRDADVAIDCLDSLTARRQLEAAAHDLGIPFVYGTVAGDEGFVMLTLPGWKGLGAILGDPRRDNDFRAEQVLGVPTLTPAGIAVLEAYLVQRALLGSTDSKQLLRHLDLTTMQLTPIIV